LLGAVPDGAIILFSGLGPIDEVQETLSVGVGALAGSTIMLLTIPFALSIIAGRVDIVDGEPNYLRKPKLTKQASLMDELTKTGVAVTQPIKAGGLTMVLTTIPYFLIQGPALFIHGDNEDIVKGEKWWAFAALAFCLGGLFYYLSLQLKMSHEGEDREKRVAVMKKMLKNGRVSISALHDHRDIDDGEATGLTTDYGSGDGDQSSHKISEFMKDILHSSFQTYDEDNSGALEHKEVDILFRDLNEVMSKKTKDALFKKYDVDGDGTLSFDEFALFSAELLNSKKKPETTPRDISESADDAVPQKDSKYLNSMVQNILVENEEEEMPEEFTNLPPEEQQAAIKKRAFIMCAVGTLLVVLFSDPMVDVFQEIAVRSGMPPFYVAFILAPLASNASELLSSIYYAKKKTTKTMTVSLSALQGAAAMNNTFCLSIFMALVFFRGLAWQYTAETIVILLMQLIIGIIVQGNKITFLTGVSILSLFPLSIVIVATLEAFGFD